MEKNTAHYPLTRVKALVKAGAVRATRSALEGAAEIGFSFKQMKDIVNALEAKDLRKSMTSNQDNTLWQDVWLSTSKDGYLSQNSDCQKCRDYFL